MQSIKKLYSWIASSLHSPYATPILGLLFFMEAIFFIPTDPVLILFCLERPRQTVKFALIATIGSVLGGITSYCIGTALWNSSGSFLLENPFVKRILTPGMFEYLCEQYQVHEWSAVFAAGFTPIPYKAAALIAGFCRIALIPFIIASIISRAARFFLYALFIGYFGVKVRKTIEQYFSAIMIGSLAITIIGFWAISYW